MMGTRAQILPVEISSGFTDDAVLEGPGATTSVDLEGGTEASSDVLVTYDYAVAHPDLFDPGQVLPQNGTITNPANGAIFQFQPYNAPNVVVVMGDATLTLSQPMAYSEISFLLSNRATQRGAGSLSFTLNYEGGATFDDSSASAVPFWEGAGDPGDGQVAASLTTVLEEGTSAVGPVQFDEYDFELDPTMGLLDSITIHGGSNKLDVYAVSGIDPMEVPEPRAWAMLFVAAAALVFTRRRANFAG